MASIDPTHLTSFQNRTFELPPIKLPIATGLTAATQAIYETLTPLAGASSLQTVLTTSFGLSDSAIVSEIIDGTWSPSDLNQALAVLARLIANKNGWLAAWSCLGEVINGCGLHKELLEDLKIVDELYAKLPSTSNNANGILADGKADFEMSISSVIKNDNIHVTGLKGMGGKSWKTDEQYAKLWDEWIMPGFAPMSPLAPYGWLAATKQAVLPQDKKNGCVFAFAGTIDFDYDIDERNKKGVEYFFSKVIPAIKEGSEELRGIAFVGLMNVDLQQRYRQVHIQWTKETAGPLGPKDVEPETASGLSSFLTLWFCGIGTDLLQWAKLIVIDSAIMAPLGYTSAEKYALNKKGVFICVTNGNIYDALWDIAYSNRVSSSIFAALANPKGVILTVAMIVGMMDIAAKRTQALDDDGFPHYGDGMPLLMPMWGIFGGRYRACERFVKYLRVLHEAAPKSRYARDLLELGEKDLTIDNEKLATERPIEEIWAKITDPNTTLEPEERKVHEYKRARNGSEIFKGRNIESPLLCDRCALHFYKALDGDQPDSVFAIPGLSPAIYNSVLAGLASAIRRIANFAGSADCCESCALILAKFVEDIGYKVLVSLMELEGIYPRKEWILLNYFIGCIVLGPEYNMKTILSGFDLTADVRFQREHVGERDTVESVEV